MQTDFRPSRRFVPKSQNQTMIRKMQCCVASLKNDHFPRPPPKSCEHPCLMHSHNTKEIVGFAYSVSSLMSRFPRIKTPVMINMCCERIY
ncbi:hypothetical protein M419DRAFT_124032 [Trichoderma reesei RUT C-30]|uniref:Uncharacterized protein n=1 Tax=Hypocrea jecorina (strain ATCC 56765 / BCRC 32924 / NRRL 11460 / Rut C-30) TaxID=1344414 RepID=A0A024S568_HYPJR|nr:hypothetical protein M419DRAFT_124032 [Trichoderma reesei RUT C-30]